MTDLPLSPPHASSSRTLARATSTAAEPLADLWLAVQLLWRGKGIIAAVVMLWVGLVGYYAFAIAQPRFTATAVLQIDISPLTLHDVGAHWPEPDTGLAGLNTQVTALTAPQLLAQVVDRLSLRDDPEFNRYLSPQSPYALRSLRTRLRHFLSGTTAPVPDAAAMRQKTVENLRAAISASRPRDTYLFEIRATSGDAQKAARIANTIATLYIQNQIAAKDAATRDAIIWLEDRVSALQRRLYDQETAITALIATAQLQDDGRLDALSNAVLALDAQIDAATAALAQQPGARMTPARAIAAARQTADRLAALRAERQRLQGQLSQQSAGLVSLHQMQREADATQVLYQSYNQRLQETRVQQGLARPDSRIIATAAPGGYAGPRKVYLLALAAVLGTLSGAAIVLVIHATQRGIYTGAQLRAATGLSGLATLDTRDLPRGRGALAAILQETRPGLTQAIFALRAAIGGAAPGAPEAAQPEPPLRGRRLLCTAAGAHSASVPVSLALAQAMGRSGDRVLVIAVGRAGLADVGLGCSLCSLDAAADMAPGEPALRPAPGASWDIVCSHDPATAQAQHHLLSDGFARDIDRLTARYDRTLILAPPVSGHPETLVMARLADQALLFLRWARTPMAEAAAAQALLQDSGIAWIGAVLTGVNKRKAGRWPVPRHSAPLDLQKGPAG